MNLNLSNVELPIVKVETTIRTEVIYAVIVAILLTISVALLIIKLAK